MSKPPEKKKPVFATVQIPCQAVSDLFPFINTSSFGIYIERRLGTWADFRSQIQAAVNSGASFYSEIFRRAAPGLRKILTLELLQAITNCDPARAPLVFENLPQEAKINISAVIDLLCTCPASPGLVEWAGRQLSCIEANWEEMLCHPKIKCVMLAYRREKWKSEKKPGDLCWGILKRDNTFHLYTTGREFQELTKPDHKMIPVDLIAQSRSGRTVKIQRDLQKINVTLVVPKFDKDLWEHQALRLRGVPFYHSFAAYRNPMPKVLLDAALDMIKQPGLMIARALLNPNVVKVQDSEEVLRALWTIFASCDRIHEFITVVAAMDVTRTENMMPSLIFRNYTFLIALFKLSWSTYCRGFISDVIIPICRNIVRGGALNLTGDPGDVDAERVFSVMANLVDGLVAKADQVPIELKHFASIVVNCVGLHYGTTEAVMLALSRLVFIWLVSPIMEKPEDFDNSLVDPESDSLKNASELVQIVANFVDFGAKYPMLIRLNSRMPQVRDSLSRFLIKLPVLEHVVAYAKPAEADLYRAVDLVYRTIFQRKEAFVQSIQGELLAVNNSPMSWGVMQFLMALGGYTPEHGLRTVVQKEETEIKAPKNLAVNDENDYPDDVSNSDEKPAKHKKKKKRGKKKNEPKQAMPNIVSAGDSSSEEEAPKKKSTKRNESSESDDVRRSKKKSSRKAIHSSSGSFEEPKKKSKKSESPRKPAEPPALTSLRNSFRKSVVKSSEDDERSPPRSARKESGRNSPAKKSPKASESDDSWFDDSSEDVKAKIRSGKSIAKAKEDTESNSDDEKISSRKASQKLVKPKKGSEDESPNAKGSSRKQSAREVKPRKESVSQSSDEEELRRSKSLRRKESEPVIKKPSSRPPPPAIKPKREDSTESSSEPVARKGSARAPSPASKPKKSESTDSDSEPVIKKPSPRPPPPAAKPQKHQSSDSDSEPVIKKPSPRAPPASKLKKDESSDSDSEPVARKGSARAPSPASKAKKNESTDSDSEPVIKKPSSRPPPPARPKKDESSDSDSEPVIKKPSPRPPPAKPKKNESTDSDSEPVIRKPSPRGPPASKPKKDKSSDSDSEPVIKKPSSRPPPPARPKKDESTDSDSEPVIKRPSSRPPPPAIKPKREENTESSGEPVARKGSARAPSPASKPKKNESTDSDSEPVTKKRSSRETPSTPKKKPDSDSDSEPRTPPKQKRGSAPGSARKSSNSSKHADDSSSRGVSTPQRRLAATIATIWSDSSDEDTKPKPKSKPPLPTPPRDSKPRKTTPDVRGSATPDVSKVKSVLSSDDSDDLSKSVFRSARLRKERRASQGKTSAAPTKPRRSSLFSSSSDSM